MITRISTLVVALLLGASLFPGTASGTQITTSPPDVGENVCTVGGLGVRDGEELPPDIPTVISCFDTEEEALSFIESGAPGDLERLLAGSGHAPRPMIVPASTAMIGKVWKGTSRSGAQLLHWGAGSGCHGVTYGFPTLPSGWDNTIRSSEGFSNCWVTHYRLVNYSGSPTINCTPYCATMASLDRESSSIVYRPVGTYG